MLNLLALKNNFNDIRNLRESIINLMKSLGDKVETLKVIYNELITNNINEMDRGLDSFHFQTKLINLELDNYQKTFKIIDNRIYGDYYKLFKQVSKFLLDSEHMLTINKTILQQYENKDYEVFKDLDNIHGYDFDSTCDIYNDIIQIIDILQNELLEREHKLVLQKIKRQSGLYIDNLISNVNYNNNYIKNNIVLFNDNANIFNSFHKTYLTRFLVKTKLFHGQINYDIKLEESKNTIDCELTHGQSIILEEDEENEIRNLIDVTDNSNKDLHIDTKSNIINELNCMISGVSDSTSNSNSNSNSNISHSPVSPEKIEMYKTVTRISSPMSEPELEPEPEPEVEFTMKNEIIRLEKNIDKIIANEKKEEDNENILTAYNSSIIDSSQKKQLYKYNNNNDLDNNNQLKCHNINCILM